MKKLLIKFSLVFSAALLLLWLAIFSSRQPDIQYGFQRQFFSSHLAAERFLSLSSDENYFAGFTSSGFYLGNYVSNGILFKSGYTLQDTLSSVIPIPDNKKLAWGMATIQMDSPVITFYDRLTPAIVRFNTNSKTSSRVALKHHQYSVAVNMGKNKYVLRTFDDKLQQDVLETEFSEPDSTRRFVPVTQGDGRFSIDGMFAADTGQHRLFYIYFYRNEFNCFDSAFHLLYTARTIDTNRTAKLEVFNDLRKKETYLSKPPPLVNAKSCVDRGQLFIYSPLKADNEPEDLANRTGDLDVYNAADGAYRSTYQLQLPRSGRITDLAAYGDRLLVLQNEMLSIYRLPTTD